MKDRIKKVAQQMFESTLHNDDVNATYEILKNNEDDMVEIFQAYTSLLIDYFGGKITDLGFAYFLITKHEVSKSLGVQVSIDAKTLGKAIALDLNAQSILREALQYAEKSNVKNNHYISYTRGEA